MTDRPLAPALGDAGSIAVHLTLCDVTDPTWSLQEGWKALPGVSAGQRQVCPNCPDTPR